MKVPREKTESSNSQLVSLKSAMVVVGVFVGAVSSDVWQGRQWILVVLFFVAILTPMRTWISQVWNKLASRGR